MRWAQLIGLGAIAVCACGGTVSSPVQGTAAQGQGALELRPPDGSSYFVYERYVVYGADGQPSSTFEIEGRMRSRRVEADITEVTLYVDTMRVARDGEDKSFPYDGQLQIVGRRDATFALLGERAYKLGQDFDPNHIRRFEALESMGRLEPEVPAPPKRAAVGEAWDSKLQLEIGHIAGPPMEVAARSRVAAVDKDTVQLATTFSGTADVGGWFTTHVQSEGESRVVLESSTGISLDVETRVTFELRRTLSNSSTSGPHRYQVHTLRLARPDAQALARARAEHPTATLASQPLDAECKAERSLLRVRIEASPGGFELPEEPVPALPPDVEPARAVAGNWTLITVNTRSTDAVRADKGIVVVLPASTPLQDVVDKLPPGEAHAKLIVRDPSLAPWPRPDALAGFSGLNRKRGHEDPNPWFDATKDAIGVCPAARAAARDLILAWPQHRGDAVRKIAMRGMEDCGCSSLEADALVWLAELGFGGPETVAINVTLDASASKAATPLQFPSTATYQDLISALSSIDLTQPIHITVGARGRSTPPPWQPWQNRAVDRPDACSDPGAIQADDRQYIISLQCWDHLHSAASPLRAFVLSTDERRGGVVIRGVRRGSLAARLGFINGDVIRAVNGHDVVDLISLVQAAVWSSAAQEISINVTRDIGSSHVWTYRLAGSPPAGD